MRILSLCLAIALLPGSAQLRAADNQPHAWGDWPRWGDQGDGSYRNPVIPSDYSDIDCIRVGSDYYAVSSTFQFSPGFVILRSRDLVNWRIVGHAVPDLGLISPEMTWSRMNRYGAGIWAGAIRYHDNKFWIYFCTPDEGYFMSTSTNPSGPWETLHEMNFPPGGGWDDPCPFWDDDGQGYLVGSAFRDGYKIHLWKMTPDGRDLVPGSDHVIHQSHGSEANKLYKINGIYYHFYSEDRGGEGRVMMMGRSSNICAAIHPVCVITHRQVRFRAAPALVRGRPGHQYVPRFLRVRFVSGEVPHPGEVIDRLHVVSVFSQVHVRRAARLLERPLHLVTQARVSVLLQVFVPALPWLARDIAFEFIQVLLC